MKVSLPSPLAYTLSRRLTSISGENFIPPGLAIANNTGTPPFNSSTVSFNTWLQGFLPSFSDRDIQRVETMYPAIGSSEEIPSYNDTYTRAGLIYRDIVLACPTYWMARAAHKKSYVGEYSIPPARHASDTIYVNIAFPLLPSKSSRRRYSDEAE